VVGPLERTVRYGPNFAQPPRALVASLHRASPAFWSQFTRGLDAATRGVNGTYVNWYRTAEHNSRVGGKPSSQHRYGTAVDLVVPSGQRFAVTNALRRQGFTVIDEGDHLHVQAFPSSSVLTRAGIRPV